MIRTILAGAALAIGLLSGPFGAVGQVPAEKFSLKISAGYGRAGFGDLDKAGA